MNKKALLLASIILSVFFVTAQSITSPDGQVELFFQLKDSVPFYRLKYKKAAVIKESKLGLTLANAPSFLKGFALKDQKTATFNESWHPVMGEVKTIVNHYNELAVTLLQPSSDRNITIRFRVFNDGLGFRYEFPQQKNLNYFVIKEEETQFALSGNNKAWWIPGDYDTEEYSYTTSSLSAVPQLFDKSYDANASQTIVPMALQTPLMMKTQDGLYVNIH
ncbi:MAG TPA: glycoside hydrolase family 97 N-terminal domain-containing protein, partial [Flavisolibacter sp.]|nr:glycoside hydrolase family 97 N-terminal domain-containing protein [Flavisolibacter sp.]